MEYTQIRTNKFKVKGNISHLSELIFEHGLESLDINDDGTYRMRKHPLDLKTENYIKNRKSRIKYQNEYNKK